MKIKFRGKTSYGKWIYGVPVEITGNIYMMSPYIQSAQLVDEKSVGQFIGMEDIHEIDIYVGDIVMWSSDHKIHLMSGAPIPCDSYEVGEVVYNVDETRYEVLVRKQKESRYSGHIPYSRVLQFYDWKVIGNVTDNHELFDGCEEGELRIDGSVKPLNF